MGPPDPEQELAHLTSQLAQDLESALAWAAQSAKGFLESARPPSVAEHFPPTLYTNLLVETLDPDVIDDEQRRVSPILFEGLTRQGAELAVLARRVGRGPMRDKQVVIRISGSDGERAASIQVRATYGFLGAKRVEFMPGDDSDNEWFLEPLMDVLAGVHSQASDDGDVFGGAVASYVAVYRRGEAVFERLLFAESMDEARELAVEAAGPGEGLVSISPNLGELD